MPTSETINSFSLIMGLLAGLTLFLYGVGLLADGLEAIASERMKSLLAKCTDNRLAGVVTGIAATTLLDSSSAVTIIVIGLVSAGLMNLTQSLGVVMGANIGTTVSSQLFALDIAKYAPIALVVGFAVRSLARSERAQQIAALGFALGLVFFGLETMGSAVEPLRDYQPFLDLMKRMENPLMGALVGAGFTSMIQSSSATMGIVITLAGQGAMTLPAGIALMLGADIGTCADTLMATVGRSREALRVGLFQLLFNVASVLLWISFTSQLAALAKMVSPSASVARHIANAHVIFNVTSVLAFIGFANTIAALLTRLVPDRKSAPPQTGSSETAS